jgi:hypothetical protein
MYPFLAWIYTDSNGHSQTKIVIKYNKNSILKGIYKHWRTAVLCTSSPPEQVIKIFLAGIGFAAAYGLF